MLISVIVCTYNRAGLLKLCLDSLANQSADSEAFETIVVDNNSTDKTPEVAKEYLERRNFRYIKEEKQGLSHARNAGFVAARGEYVAYIDDDAKADREWVKNIIAFIRKRPEVFAFGGPYRQFSLNNPPAWFKDSYGSWGLGSEERPIGENEWLNGTNMVFRRLILVEVNGFDASFGMSGNMVRYGEETNLLIKIKKMRRPIYYVPDMVVYHLFLEYKQRVGWFLKSSYAAGRDSWRIFEEDGGGGFKVLIQTLSAFARFIPEFTKAMLRGLHYKTAFIDSSANLFYLVGRLFNIKKI